MFRSDVVGSWPGSLYHHATLIKMYMTILSCWFSRSSSKKRATSINVQEQQHHAHFINSRCTKGPASFLGFESQALETQSYRMYEIQGQQALEGLYSSSGGFDDPGYSSCHKQCRKVCFWAGWLCDDAPPLASLGCGSNRIAARLYYINKQQQQRAHIIEHHYLASNLLS
jgi:hypothetical protein